MTTKMREMGHREIRKTKFQDNEFLRKLKVASLTPIEPTYRGDFLSADRVLFIEHLVKIEKLVLQIGNSQDDCFEVEYGKIEPINKIGWEICQILKKDFKLWYYSQFYDYLKYFQISPNFEIFMEEFTKIGARVRIFFRKNLAEIAHTECSKLNGAVSAIRERINTPEFRKQMHNFRRSSDKNLRSFQLYIEKCFEICPRLLVLRIDLYYKNGTFDGKSLGESFEMVQQHWQKWIRRFKNKMDKAYVGYAKILEYGYQKSLYFHVFLLLDGSLVRQDIAIAKRAGKDWSDVVTQGVGRSHNCNLKKENYNRFGIGMVYEEEKDRRAALNDIMAYMIKINYFIKLVTPDGSCVFSKGDMPRKKLKLWRPRETLVS